MTKETKTTNITDVTPVQKVTKKSRFNKNSAKNGIMGISLLFGVLSIGYSSAFIIMGTDGWVPVVMVAPQMLLAGLILVWKFCK